MLWRGFNNWRWKNAPNCPSIQPGGTKFTEALEALPPFGRDYDEGLPRIENRTRRPVLGGHPRWRLSRICSPLESSYSEYSRRTPNIALASASASASVL